MRFKASSANSSPTVSTMGSNSHVGGIRKKNGHKEKCICPICKNMKHAKGGAGYDVKSTNNLKTQTAGRKKGNGHKANCGCPICMNMKKSLKKHGGNDEEETSSSDDEEETSNSDEGEETSSSDEGEETSSNDEGEETSSSNKGKNDDEKSTNILGGRKKGNGHKHNCGCPICMNMKKSKRRNITMKGGKKPKGHKANCGCPICKKIRNKKHKQTKRR